MKTLWIQKTNRGTIKSNSAGIVILVLGLMVFLLVGCADGLDIPFDNGITNSNDGADTPVTDTSQKVTPQKFSYADLKLGEFKPPFTQEYDYKTQKDGLFYGQLTYPGAEKPQSGIVRTDPKLVSWREDETVRHELETPFLGLKKQVFEV